MSDHPIPRDQLECLYKRARSRIQLLENENASLIVERDMWAARVKLLEARMLRAEYVLHGGADGA